MQEQLSTRVADNVLSVIDTSNALSLANCKPNDGSETGSAFSLVQGLLDLAHRLGAKTSETAMAHLCYIRDSLVKECDAARPSYKTLLKYAYIILIILEEHIGVDGVDPRAAEELRHVFDAIHGILSHDNVKLGSPWRTKRGDVGYISEVTARVRAFFNTIPPPRLECPSRGHMGALSPPQRMLQYIISKQGPADQRVLVAMRPGLGKSLVCLNVFNNYVDRPRMLAAASDELLANIKSEDIKTRDNKLIDNYAGGVLNGVVFCDFRYADAVKPGPNDPPGAVMPVGFGNKAVRDILDDPRGVVVIDEAHELYDMDVKTAVNRAGSFFALAQKHAVEFRGLLQRSKCQVVVALTGTPFSDDVPRPKSQNPGGDIEERSLAHGLEDMASGPESYVMEDGEFHSYLVGPSDASDVRDDTTASALVQPPESEGRDMVDMDDALSMEVQPSELAKSETSRRECSLLFQRLDDAMRTTLREGFASMDDLCGVVSTVIHTAGQLPLDATETNPEYIAKVNSGIERVVGDLNSGGTRRELVLSALGLATGGGVGEGTFRSSRTRKKDIRATPEDFDVLTGGLTNRGDALCRMITRNAPPWQWSGCVLTANYYTGTDAFLSVDPEMKLLPSLFGTSISRSVNVVQVDLDSTPEAKRGGAGSQYKGPDDKYKSNPDCRISSIPFLVNTGASRTQFDAAALKEPERLIPKLNKAVESVLLARNPRPIVNERDGSVIFESVEVPIEGVSTQALVTFRVRVPKERTLFDNILELEGVRSTLKPSIRSGHMGSAIVQFPNGEAHILPLLPRSALTTSIVRYDVSKEDEKIPIDAIVAIPLQGNATKTVFVRNQTVIAYEEVRCAIDRAVHAKVPSGAVVHEIVFHNQTATRAAPDYFAFSVYDGDGDDGVTMYFRNDHSGSFLPRQLVMIAADEGFRLFEQLLYIKGGAEVRNATVPLIVAGDASTDERKRAINAFLHAFNGADTSKDIAIVEVGKFSTGLDVVGTKPERNSRPLGCSFIHHVTEPTTAVQYLQRTLRVSRFCQRRAGRICRIVMYQVVGGRSGIAQCSLQARRQLTASMQQLFGANDTLGILGELDAISMNKDMDDLMNSSSASAILAGGTFFRRSYYPSIGHLSGLDTQMLEMVHEFIKSISTVCDERRKNISETPCVAHSAKECPSLVCTLTGDVVHPCVHNLEGSLCANISQEFGNFASWMQQLSARDVEGLLRSEVAVPTWDFMLSNGICRLSDVGKPELVLPDATSNDGDRFWSHCDRLKERVSPFASEDEVQTFACALVAEQWLHKMGTRLQMSRDSLRVFPEFCASLMAIMFFDGQRLYSSRTVGRAPNVDQHSRASRLLERLKHSSQPRVSALASAMAKGGGALLSMLPSYGGTASGTASLGNTTIVSVRGFPGVKCGVTIEDAVRTMNAQGLKLDLTNAEDARRVMITADMARRYGCTGAGAGVEHADPGGGGGGSKRGGGSNKMHGRGVSRHVSDTTILDIYEKQMESLWDGKSTAFEWASTPAHLFVPLLAVQIYAFRLQTARSV